MTSDKSFEYIRENFVLLPYVPVTIDFKEDVLVDIFQRLKEEDLYTTVFHDNPSQTFNQFVSFFSSPLVALSFFCVQEDIGGIQVEKPAGMCWLTDISHSDRTIKRGNASFVFFKEYQSPKYTTPLANIGLEFWFTQLNMDVVLGLTPELNRAALIFIRRLGFKEAGRVPEYTLLYGQKCSGVITYLDRSSFMKELENGKR